MQKSPLVRKMTRQAMFSADQAAKPCLFSSIRQCKTGQTDIEDGQAIRPGTETEILKYSQLSRPADLLLFFLLHISGGIQLAC